MSFAFAFLVIVLMGLYVCRQYPKESLSDRRFRMACIVCHVTGHASLFLVFLLYRFLQGEPLQNAVLFISSVYFVMICCMGLTYLLLNIIRWIMRKKGRVVHRKKLTHIIVFAMALFVALLGFVNSLHLTTTAYAMTINKPCMLSKLDVVVLTDLHLGAGMTSRELTQAVQQTNAEKPDVVLIVGDLIDETTSEALAEDAAQQLSGLQAVYGVYFVPGNHDSKSSQPIDTLLTQAGIIKLDNEAVLLADSVNLVGQSCEKRQPVDAILAEQGMDVRQPTIVMQHIPRQLRQIADSGADLIVCGHTHGYHYPFGGVVLQCWNDLVYGQRRYGDTLAITSSGAAAWGFHYKYPSDDEIVVIHVRFSGEE